MTLSKNEIPPVEAGGIFSYLFVLLVAVNVGHIRLQIVVAGEEGGKRHYRHNRVGYNMILPKESASGTVGEVGKNRLKQHKHGANHLGYGLDFKIGRASCRERV